MKKTLILLSGILLAGSLLTGCSEDRTYIDETTTIETRVNEEFTIGVGIDPIGKYFWEQDFDESRLELVDSTCVACSIEELSDIGIYGSYNTFRYRALKVGATEIRLTHRRPITGEIIDRKVFRVNVR